MKVAIVINSQRLTPELENQLKNPDLANQYGITYDLFFPKPAELESTLDQLTATTYNAILIGGGDGTVRTALQVLINKNIPVIILPLGTFNVLAKTLGYPNDINKIFEIIKNKKTTQIDLAEVNGNIIVNHAWLGFYYYIIKAREKHKHKLGRSRILKAMFNAIFLFKRLPFFVFEIEVNGKKIAYKTCLLFISNNETSTNLFNFTEKKAVSQGRLAVNILSVNTRWQLFLCMFDVLINGLKHSHYTETFSVKELIVNADTPKMKIVIDGELFSLEAPLNFVIYPKTMTMLKP